MHKIDHKLLILEDYLKKRHLRKSRVRELVIAQFLKTKHHVAVEELLELCRQQEPHIGFATVYRTLKLLVDAGLAHERDFNTGRKLYENAESGDNHDHLVCLECGRVEEFEDQQIINARSRIARNVDFQIVSYRHEMYGFCQRCSDKKKSD